MKVTDGTVGEFEQCLNGVESKKVEFERRQGREVLRMEFELERHREREGI